jgi:hypothetical protein
MRTDHFLSLISNLGNLLILYNLLIINNLFSRKEKSISRLSKRAHQSSENLLQQQQQQLRSPSGFTFEKDFYKKR